MTVRFWHFWASHDAGSSGAILVGFKEYALAIELPGVVLEWRRPRLSRWRFDDYEEWRELRRAERA
jgi:hypothetical protein